MAQRSSLYSLVFTIFNDSLGWGIVLTIFAPLLMNGEGGLLPPNASLHLRTVILGLLIGCYSLTQFLFMPLVGAISDHFGRKKVLEWTIIFAGVSCVLSAVSIWRESLILLFASRILAGIFSANSATAQAAIADSSSEREKAKNLSVAGIAGGLAWVIGPPIGGFLSTKAYVPWADFATPLWFVAALFFLNYIWVARAFEETYVKKEQKKHDWKQEIKDLSKLAKIPRMSAWLLITLFFYLGWGFYVLFYPTLLVQRFHFDQSSIGLISGYVSIFWLVSSTAMNRGLAAAFKPEAFILLGLPLVGVSSIVIAFAPTITWWYFALPVLAMCASFIWIGLLALLSNLAGKENQGKVFGIGQALMSLAMFVSPILSGPLAAINEKMPLTIGGIILIGTGIFAAFYYFRKNTKTD
jgi:DHA1 family tetracycline resistance protein-like MFS transporter